MFKESGQWLSGTTLKTNINSWLRMGLMHKAQLQLLLEFLLVPNVQVIQFCWEKQTKPNQTKNSNKTKPKNHKSK